MKINNITTQKLKTLPSFYIFIFHFISFHFWSWLSG